MEAHTERSSDFPRKQTSSFQGISLFGRRRLMKQSLRKHPLSFRQLLNSSRHIQVQSFQHRRVNSDATPPKDYVELLWPNQLKRKVKLQQGRSETSLFRPLNARGPPGQFPARRSVRQPKTVVNALAQYVTHSKHYYQQKKSSEEYHSDHLAATFDGIKAIARLPTISEETLQAKAVVLPRENGRKTLVLDLDETLVHCCEGSEKADFFVPIDLPNGTRVLAGLRLRPFLVECLTKVKTWFEVVIFTASHQCYADAVLNFIDPAGELIDYRLYRESCIQVGGFNVKDLRILNRNLKDVVIVDNLVQSFANQLSNGVAIISWYDDRNDKELFKLIKYLKLLAHVEDVREVNQSMFKLNSFYEDFLRTEVN